MDLEKLKPWNWFKHEESGHGGAGHIPVKRNEVKAKSAGAGSSLLRLHDDMDRWFDDAFKSFGFPSMESRFESRLPAFHNPKLDICGDDKAYQVTLDVPGLEENDISLEIRGDMLLIKGEKEEKSEDKDKHYYHMERSYGSFQRTLSLPDDANADEIKANLEKGVLKLDIPRRAEATKEAKRISISSK